MSERRDATRRVSTIYYPVREGGSGLYLGEAEDVSRSGLRLHGPVQITPGTRLTVTIDVDARDHANEQVAVQAECCWCSDDPDGHTYQCGMTWVFGVVADQALIDRFAASMPFDDLRSF